MTREEAISKYGYDPLRGVLREPPFANQRPYLPHFHAAFKSGDGADDEVFEETGEEGGKLVGVLVTEEDARLFPELEEKEAVCFFVARDAVTEVTCPRRARRALKVRAETPVATAVAKVELPS